MSGHKLTGAGLSMTLESHVAFGDDDCLHIVTAREGQKGIIVAHARFISAAAFFDDEQNFPAAPVAELVQEKVQGYFEQGM